MHYFHTISVPNHTKRIRALLLQFLSHEVGEIPTVVNSWHPSVDLDSFHQLVSEIFQRSILQFLWLWKEPRSRYRCHKVVIIIIIPISRKLNLTSVHWLKQKYLYIVFLIELNSKAFALFSFTGKTMRNVNWFWWVWFIVILNLRFSLLRAGQSFDHSCDESTATCGEPTDFYKIPGISFDCNRDLNRFVTKRIKNLRLILIFKSTT